MLRLLLLVLIPVSAIASEPYASTYVPLASDDLLIVNVTVLTGTGERLTGVDVRLSGGRIEAIGSGLSREGVRLLDAAGQFLTPGIIDVHSHLGNGPSPSIASTSDVNEMTEPNTAQVWAEHSVWPQDPQFPLALAGGVTTMQILPGSGNLFGGRGVTLKNVPARTVQGMKFPGAKQGLKMACGENPKRVYGERTQAPSTRMGNVAGYRAAWTKARHYAEQRAKPVDKQNTTVTEPDLAMETLVGVLNGEILVHNHCYRADEMAVMIDIAREFGYRISAFHHAVESYKIADLLAEEGICSAMWADWWGFKLEAFDGIPQNIPLVDQAGACAIVHSDDAQGIQRLNQEAAKAMAAARRVGMAVDEAQAIGWITLNAAIALGIEKRTGSIEVGKAADVVLWDRNPFSVYAHAEKVFIDGYLYFDRSDPARQPLTDFDLEQTARGRRL
ncbi:MAG: amidohydrolase [Gammaproteobacteria bacterium]|nr:amidohydrolase [Gammaproteobacteria bacterium]